MIKHNALIIDGVSTASFPFKVIVHEAPTMSLSESKTTLLEHQGISGAIVQINPHRSLMKKSYTLYLVKPTEEQLYGFMKLFAHEKFWLEEEQIKSTWLWCYKVDMTELIKDAKGVYTTKVTFICHPTKFFKKMDMQLIRANGVLNLKGSALAFPKITVTGNSSRETYFTIGKDVIKFEKLTEPLVMINDPEQPSFQSVSGKTVNWSGDFITLNPLKGKTIGVVFGPGVTSLKFETVWGWV